MFIYTCYIYIYLHKFLLVKFEFREEYALPSMF